MRDNAKEIFIVYLLCIFLSSVLRHERFALSLSGSEPVLRIFSTLFTILLYFFTIRSYGRVFTMSRARDTIHFLHHIYRNVRVTQILYANKRVASGRGAHREFIDRHGAYVTNSTRYICKPPNRETESRRAWQHPVRFPKEKEKK